MSDCNENGVIDDDNELTSGSPGVVMKGLVPSDYCSWCSVTSEGPCSYFLCQSYPNMPYRIGFAGEICN